MATNSMTFERSAPRPVRARRTGESTPSPVSARRWSPSAEDTVRFLGAAPLFATLSGEDLRRVAEIAVPRTFAAGQVVFREGDTGDTCYVVWSGRARAVRMHRDGRTITLAGFGPRDIFGELAVFERERRSATVEAVSTMRALAVLGGDMRRLLGAHPGMALGLGIALGRRLRTTNDRLSRQAFQSVQSRVAGVLAQLLDAAAPAGAGAGAAQGGEGAAQGGEGAAQGGEGAAQGGGRVVASQADIAQLAGCSRESASRFLAQLERAGVISQGRTKIVVLRRARLDAYVF